MATPRPARDKRTTSRRQAMISRRPSARRGRSRSAAGPEPPSAVQPD
jgi:hypothetical protein